MPLKKATQAVIAPNICTTDTTQTITGQKSFSNPIDASVTGSCTELNPGKTIQISGDVVGAATLFNGSQNISIPATIKSGASITSPAFSGSATGSLISKVIKGVTDGTSALDGFLGEVISSARTSATAIAITSPNIVNVTSISLPAGEWYINGQVDYKATASASITVLTQGISLSPSTFGAQDTFSRIVCAAVTPGTSNDIGIPIRGQTISITGSGTTPVYLLGQATFSGSGQSVSAYGTIEARRVR